VYEYSLTNKLRTYSFSIKST